MRFIDILDSKNVLDKKAVEAVLRKMETDKVSSFIALQLLRKDDKIIKELHQVIKKYYSDNQVLLWEGNIDDIKYSHKFMKTLNYKDSSCIISETTEDTLVFMADYEERSKISQALMQVTNVKWYLIKYADYKRWMDMNGKELILENVRHQQSFSDIELVQEEKESALDSVLSNAEQGQILSRINEIIIQGVESGASDIHFEPGYKSEGRVRYRVDGTLDTIVKVPNEIIAKMTRAWKTVSKMSDATQEPLNGNVTVRSENRLVDLRISTMPTVDGEKLEIRILNSSTLENKLEALGMSHDKIKIVRGMSKRSSGLILFTGPTGAGKSQSIFSLISEMDSESMSIYTLEDPVEQRIKGITQIKANEKLTFSKILRDVLRQDPDIIMVGEVRDKETADIVMEAGNTGHLVLSTLHTNTACSAVTRLIELGVEPYLIGANLIGVVNQRLLKKVCPSCSKYYKITEEDLEEHNLSEEWLGKIVKKPMKGGCAQCDYKGYKGRKGIYEVLKMDKELESLIKKDMSVYEFENMAKRKGLVLLRNKSADYLKEGTTSLEEVTRLLYDDNIVLEYNAVPGNDIK